MITTTTRTTNLMRTLHDRRREIEVEVLSRVRGGRLDRPAEGRDNLEDSEADTQSDIALALLQMKAETLTRIDLALARLSAGKYGTCFECEGEISERRLRALPFAVRCQECEEQREVAQGQARHLAQRRDGLSLFASAARP